MDETPDIPTEHEYQAALARGLLPIREVARRTGVNPVTLRAWERRYGLIVPLRTSKGHRLYAEDEVARIQLILTWLNRGVAVGQVKGLLKAKRPAIEAESEPDSLWDNQRRQLLNAIGALSERQLDECFNSAMALYPPRTLYRQLLQPLLAELELRWRCQFGAQVERVFLYSWLRSKLGTRLYHNNRLCTGAPLLLINFSELPMEPGLWLTAWLASSDDCLVEVFDWPVPPAELALAIARIEPRALLLYSSQTLSADGLPRLLNNSTCPILLAGPAAAIHREIVQAQNNDKLPPTCPDDPLAAVDALAELGLLHNR
ncbi:MerR family transcriptional regulator [Pseudomonas boanensis]|uniref:MerR family transcriptional regulator n=1 Tax=Metapseudomonas boanensis TaxID=2822138 RepID=UPI0035D487DA